VALFIALLFVAGAAWGTTSFPRETVRPAPVQAPPLSTDQRSEFERWWDVQQKVNMPFDNGGAKVLIVEFADFQCPQCRVQYFALKPILDKYTDHPQDVKILMKQYPLNSDCNASVPSKMHVASCDAAAAVVMARWKGQFAKMEDWLFMHQEELSPVSVRGAAADVVKITDFEAQYPKAIQEVKTDTALGAALGVNSTPTFFINGKRIPGGGLPPQYFAAAIDLELKRAK
jgi:protein-disulfide isomerase